MDENKQIEAISNFDLTEKQKLFIQEYLFDNNGIQATIRAGYSSYWACEQPR